MGTAIRRLEIRIDQTGSAEKGIRKLSGGLGALVGPAAMAAAAVAAVGAATIAVGAKLISMGSSAEEMMGKFDVVFGDSAPMAMEALDEFGNAVGRSKFELMEMASTVQDTFVPLGFAREEAAKGAIAITKLAVDVASFNDSLETDVMRDFQSALVGNHETVRKYGIIITQATLDQELLNMGVQDGVKGATEQQKVIARMNLLWAGTTDAQGDAARTSESWANQMRRLKSTISEAATEMGLNLLPAMTPILIKAGDLAEKILPVLGDKFAWVAENILPQIIEKFERFGQSGFNLAGDILPKLITAFQDIQTWVEAKLIPTIVKFNENTIKPLIQSIKDWIAEFKERLEPVLDRINVMIEDRLKPALAEFKVSWDRISEALGVTKEEGDSVGDTLWLIESAIKAVIWVVEAASNVFSALSIAVREVARAIDWLTDKWKDMKRAAQDAIDAIPDWLRPGSPTPFELGLRGIGDALSGIDLGQMGTSMVGAPALARAGGGGGITVNLTYSPVVSLADRYEAEEKLAPYIANELRKLGVVSG